MRNALPKWPKPSRHRHRQNEHSHGWMTRVMWSLPFFLGTDPTTRFKGFLPGAVIDILRDESEGCGTVPAFYCTWHSNAS